MLDKADKTFINALEYILSPSSQLPITSSNHKLLLYEFFNVEKPTEYIDFLKITKVPMNIRVELENFYTRIKEDILKKDQNIFKNSILDALFDL